MTGSSTIRINLVACLSSLTTAAVILLLIGQHHDSTMTNVLDRLRGSSSFASSGPISACEAPHPQEHAAPSLSEEHFPRKFVLDPWRYPLYNRNETSRETGWWGSLLTPNGGFLKVEEHNHEIQDYGVSMFHQLHCLAMV